MKRLIIGIWKCKLGIGLYFAAVCVILGFVLGGAYFWPSNLEASPSALLASICWTVSFLGFVSLIWLAVIQAREDFGKAEDK